MGPMELVSSRAKAVVDHLLGGRLASLVVDGHELLVSGDERSDPLMWGSYPMVPWAGRVRRGKFRSEGRAIHLPINYPPHAIHGTGFSARWQPQADGSLTHTFPTDWQFTGHAVQRFELDDTSLVCWIEVHADKHPMPAMAGWHPWFVRPVEYDFHATSMWLRDEDHIPSGEIASPPPPGPYDDCFAGVTQPVVLRFGDGGPTVRLTSNCEVWTVFDEPRHAICVEPQTGPADQFNLGPRSTVEPGQPMVVWMKYDWS